jgi:hypothetical protein
VITDDSLCLRAAELRTYVVDVARPALAPVRAREEASASRSSLTTSERLEAASTPARSGRGRGVLSHAISPRVAPASVGRQQRARRSLPGRTRWTAKIAAEEADRTRELGVRRSSVSGEGVVGHLEWTDPAAGEVQVAAAEKDLAGSDAGQLRRTYLACGSVVESAAQPPRRRAAPLRCAGQPRGRSSAPVRSSTLPFYPRESARRRRDQRIVVLGPSSPLSRLVRIPRTRPLIRRASAAPTPTRTVAERPALIV